MFEVTMVKLGMKNDKNCNKTGIFDFFLVGMHAQRVQPNAHK